MLLHMLAVSNIATRRAFTATGMLFFLTGRAPGRTCRAALLQHTQPKGTGASMSPTIEQLSEDYLKAWSARDLQTLAALLHADIEFRSPNAQTRGREAYLAAVGRMLPLLIRLDVHARLHGPASAMFVYDFVCREPIGAVRTAERVCIEDGLIRDSEVFFDPRPFEALAQARAAAAAATRA
jgi:hypothetical protein